MAAQIVTRPSVKPRKRVRDPRVVSRYHEIRAGLLCEYCRRSPGVEVNHLLHGQQKEDAFWNLVHTCRACHQDPVFGFHGSSPAWDEERSLRMKLKQGFVLPREAWAYLDGVDAWPGTHPDPVDAERLAEAIADKDRRGSRR